MIGRKTPTAALVLFLVGFLPPAALAATLHVPGDYPTIQAAIDAALDGDTILVASGTYLETIDFLGKAVHVLSSDGPQVTIIDGNQLGDVVLFANGEGLDSILEGFTVQGGLERGVLCENASSATIRGNHITANLRGVECRDSSNSLIYGNEITDNSHPQSAGGIRIDESSPILEQNLIHLNRARDGSGGGIYIRGSSSSPQILDNIIQGNGSVSCDSYGCSGSGGGIYCRSAAWIEIRGNSISSNSTEWYGGGIYLGNTDGVIEDNTFSFNRVKDWEVWAFGGGIYLSGGDVTIRNNTFHDNRSEAGDGGGIYTNSAEVRIAGNTFTENTAGDYGGALYCSSGSATIDHNTFSANYAGRSGGGIHLYRCDAIVEDNIFEDNWTRSLDGGALHSNDSAPQIRRNRFARNSAGDRGGALATSWYGGELTIERNEFQGNRAFRGGAMAFWNATAFVAENKIEGNTALADGGGIYYESGEITLESVLVAANHAGTSGGGMYFTNCRPILAHCSVVGNGADVAGGGFYCGTNTDAKLTNLILWANHALDGPEGYVGTTAEPSTLLIRYSDVEGGRPAITVEPGCTLTWGQGMIDADPEFVDPLSGDYTLQSTSPCIDVGHPDTLPSGTDLSGNPRLLDGDLNRFMVVDLGAHEFDHVHLEMTGSFVPGGTVTFNTTGTPGLIVYLILGSASGESLFRPYGSLFVDLTAPWALFAFTVIPSTLDLVVPVNAPTPLPLVFQELAVDTWGAGNLSNAQFHVLDIE